MQNLEKQMGGAPQSKEEERYELTLQSFANPQSLKEAVKLIYGSSDKNLLASVGITPYIVGRSFSKPEQIEFHEALKQISVGHRFKSQLSGNLIEFRPPKTGSTPMALPPDSPAEVKQKDVRFQWKLLGQRRFLVLAGGLALIIALIFGVYSNLKSWIQPSSKAPHFRSETSGADSSVARNPGLSETLMQGEAQIREVSRRVELRTRSDLGWSRAQVGSELERQDSIRTFENSSAMLQYREGSQVRLQENTLLVIGSDDASHREVELTDGSIRARILASETPQKFTISTKKGKLTLEGPRPGEDAGSTQVETRLSGDSLQVSVASGSAHFEPQSADQEPIVLSARQQITASGEEISSPSSYTPALDLFTPQDAATISLNENSNDRIRFEWEALGQNARYTWKLGGDPEMSTILLSQNTQDPSIELNFIDHGTVYWKVQATFDGIEYESIVRTLHVNQARD